jgi:two-component system, NtrC family, nitrogen regulation sensor histidine kinase NtrY
VGIFPLKKLRHKLILVFLAATIAPTAAILWMSVALIRHSLSYVSIDDLDAISKSLQGVALDYYHQARRELKEEAIAGRIQPERFAEASIPKGPAFLQQFRQSKETERFELAQPDGDRLLYLVRHGPEIRVYSRNLAGVRMEELTRQYKRARAQVENIQQRDLQRGFTYTLIFLTIIVWLLALATLLYLANRISRPIQELTGGLHRLSQGDFDARLNSRQGDEVGRAVQAFNQTADRLRQNRDRLVYLTQVASWQMLARKMAHELKNSLTPIRLTVEEILARSPAGERPFLEQASQVVIGEVESLERRVRAFSEFAAEPPMNPCRLDLNTLLEERIHFLEVAYPDVNYQFERKDQRLTAWADVDQVKGILTNLLENAAEAAGRGGTVCAVAYNDQGKLVIEVHDSGSGLSEEARRSLFEPTISFKQNGMGLGLSISRKNALLAGGDLQSIDGTLGGAGFRLVLPALISDILSGKNEKHGS